MPKVQKNTEITHAHVTFIPYDAKIRKSEYQKYRNHLKYFKIMLTPISLGEMCGEKVLLGFHKCQKHGWKS